MENFLAPEKLGKYIYVLLYYKYKLHGSTFDCVILEILLTDLSAVFFVSKKIREN
jgi:hypothetical protein